MKLTSDSVDSLQTLVHTAMIANISTLVIDSIDDVPVIRGADEKKTTIIITKENVPALGGKQIAISRLGLLSSRLSLIKNQGTVNIDAVEHKDGKNISFLELSNEKTKAQFRCSNVEMVNSVPKSFNDSRLWKLDVPSTIVGVLTQAMSAMQSEKITISSKNLTTINFECSDANNDVFSSELDVVPVALSTTTNTSFVHSYAFKSILPLFKEISKDTTSFELFIGERGSLSFKVNGFDFFIIPQA